MGVNGDNFNNNLNSNGNNSGNNNYYYNNYNYNITHNQLDPHVRMAQTALVLSLVSIPLCLIPSVGIPMAGVAILLGILSKGINKKHLPQARKCFIYGTIGLILSYVLMIHSYYVILTDPSMREQLNTMSEKMYGISFDDALKNLGVSTDE